MGSQRHLLSPEPSLWKFTALWVLYGSFFLYYQYLSDWITFLCIIAKVISIIYYSYHSLYTDRVLRDVLEEKTDLCNVLNESSRIIWTYATRMESLPEAGMSHQSSTCLFFPLMYLAPHTLYDFPLLGNCSF